MSGFKTYKNNFKQAWKNFVVFFYKLTFVFIFMQNIYDKPI